jgi:4-hydroxythreonine-4-phosphate dehydrogenase
MVHTDRPRLAVTLGDPAGIGPEVALRALSDPAIRSLADFAVFGCPCIDWMAVGGAVPSFVSAACDLADWDGRVEGVTLVRVPRAKVGGIDRGRPSPESGEASIRFVLAGVKAVRAGWADGIVTAPISKEAVGLAGYPWPGHTELLAEKFEAPEVAMMFAGGPIRTVLATIHVPLTEAIRSLSVERILSVTRLANESLKRDFGLELPRIGVCGLNPHAGEGGRFGHEEREIIGPAVERASAEGIGAFGPVAPDTAFYQAREGRFDLVVAMYHDQGLIAVKTLAFETSVNVTLGLPAVRTSPDHGTAYDIAGRGRADPGSMKAAVRMAAEMVTRRRGKEV